MIMYVNDCKCTHVNCWKIARLDGKDAGKKMNLEFRSKS